MHSTRLKVHQYVVVRVLIHASLHQVQALDHLQPANHALLSVKVPVYMRVHIC